MKVIVMAPEKEPEVKEIKRGLESLQAVVGGYIEAIYPFDDEVALVCNEEGKLNGLPVSMALVNNGQLVEMIAGTCFICGIDKDDFCSLSDEMCAKYMDKFENPVGFVLLDGMVPAYEI